MNDIIEHLDTIKIPNITKITRIPGIEVINIKGVGRLFGIKYFLFSSSPNSPIVIRFTSTDKSFSKLYGIDIYNKKMNPDVGIQFKDNLPEKELIKFISDLPKSVKSKNVSENTALGEYLLKLSEQGRWKFIGDVAKEVLKNPRMLWMGLMLILSIGLTIRYYIVKIRNWREEQFVSGELEQRLNKKLFQGQKYDEPAFKMYANLTNFIKFVALGKAPAIILCGPPGMSKTYIVKRTFYFEKLIPGKDYNIEKGSSLNATATYDLLYFNRDKILVLDDFDTPLRDESTVNMLKAITDSYDKRILSFPRERVMTRDDSGNREESSSPRKFEYRGKLIIITNLKKAEIDRALLSRAPVFEVNFSTKQVLIALEELLNFVNPEVPYKEKREVLDYILLLYKKHPSLEVDFRAFKNSVDAKIGNPLYWKEMVKTIVGLG